MSTGIVLRALDGSNPLAFLAALGAFRLLHLRDPGSRIRMSWVRDGFWQPWIFGVGGSEEDICHMLLDAPCVPLGALSELGKNITVEPARFSKFVRKAAEAAERSDWRGASFAAAFGCEVCREDDKDRIKYTDFCFITGSGHQDFLGTIAGLIENVTAEHIRIALFSGWRADKGLSMRWDPSDAAQYALRWTDPSKDGASAVWGANRLAIEALPLFPTQPIDGGLRTTGFRRLRRREPEFTWPIWTAQASLDTVRSLVALCELQEEEPERESLRQRSIEEIYRSQRVRIGQGANFKVSFRPARAI